MWRLNTAFHDTLRLGLKRLYPDSNVERLLERFALIAGRYNFLQDQCSRDAPYWNEKSGLLVTYGDMVTRPDERPLKTLYGFLRDYLPETFSGVHVLPFFPASSDDGFSVIDYNQVDPDLGGWEDIERLAGKFKLMVDLVLNHVSSRSKWFEDYVGSIAPARDYFIEVDPQTDLSAVVRPRTGPFVTQVYTVAGERHVWTTFSADQVDLNVANPDVLFELLDIMLGYIAHGARIIRLDAIAYLWKEIGASCVNLPQTHEVVRLLRAVVNNVTPGVVLLTETNLPHAENISYFGNGDEAQLVYQFSLPPLLLLTLYSGSARHLREWAKTLTPPPEGCSFLNFTASHDGIGIRPLEGLISDRERDDLIQAALDIGGLVSNYRDEDGQEQPYELNITYFEAMKDPDLPDDIDRQIRRFLCSQTIMLGLRGIPAVYFHSLTATGNNHKGVAATGQNRTINRGRWRDDELRARLDDEKTVTARVFRQYTDLLVKRGRQPAFHPDAAQEVLDLPDHFFGIIRGGGAGQSIVCLHNVSGEYQDTALADLGGPMMGRKHAFDLISDNEVSENLRLAPYQCCWLTV